MEKELIGKIQSLRTIKPTKAWESRTELMILGHKPRVWDAISWPQINTNFVQPKYALAFGSVFIVLVCILSFGILPVINSNPGQVVVYGADYYLSVAQQKLDLIKKGSAADKITALADAKIALKKAQTSLPAKPANTQESAKLVEKITNIQSTFNDVKATLGEDAASLGSDVDNVRLATKTMLEKEMYRLKAQDEINSLNSSTLTEKQKPLFEEAKRLFNNGNYEQALEKILELSNNQ